MNYKEAIDAYIAFTEQEKMQKDIILDQINLVADDILLRSSQLVHMTATAIVFNEAADKMLMIHHNIYNTWACVGGHADGMDDLMAVARKELEEETGISRVIPISKNMVSLDILPVGTHMKNGVFVPNHLHLNATYAFTGFEREQVHIKPDENSAVTWIPVSSLRAYCKEDAFVDVYFRILERLKDGFY